MYYNHFELVILLIYLDTNKTTFVIRFTDLVICDKYVCHCSKHFLFSPGLNAKFT